MIECKAKYWDTDSNEKGLNRKQDVMFKVKKQRVGPGDGGKIKVANVRAQNDQRGSTLNARPAEHRHAIISNK